MGSSFNKDEVDFILANDIIEHHFHWEAVKILKDFFQLLKESGKAEIRVPDTEHIIKSWKYSTDIKIKLLYGGQDFPQGIDKQMDESRKEFPQYFCHKFGWTMKLMKKELLEIGFKKVECKRAGSNFITIATK